MEDFDASNYENLEELQAALEEHRHKVNRMPNEDFDFLCSLDVHQLLYSPFGPESPIQMRKRVPRELLEEMPFLHLTHIFLNRIGEVGQLKLTQGGNLPVKWVKELYGLGLVKEHVIEHGITKLYKDADSISLTNVKIITTLAGLTKKRHNKLSLTQKGKKLLKGTEDDIAAFFSEIFLTYFQHFNWGYHDGFEDNSFVQQFGGYLLYLVLQYGHQEKKTSFYAEKLLKAFPMMEDSILVPMYVDSMTAFLSNCIHLRLFIRFFDYWGFSLAPGEFKDSFRNKPVQTRPILKEVLYLEKGKFQFWTGGAEA